MTGACLEAGLSFGCAAAFLFTLVFLHRLRPELDPSWRMISEYAIGHYGWIMRLGLICLSVSCLALFFVLHQKGVTPGDSLLAVVSIGTAGSAILPTDPITTPWRRIGLIGGLHTAFAALFVTGFPIAITAVAWNAMKVLLPAPVWLLWISLPVWIGLVAFVASLFYCGAMRSGFGPRVRVGWPNRFMMATYSAWLMVAAYGLCDANVGT